MDPKVTALAIGMTLLSVSVPVYLVFGTPRSTEVEGVRDSDGDGIPDDLDFYDQGNGGVSLEIGSFNGECGNWFGPCQPQFEIAIDIDFDGDYDLALKSPSLTGNELHGPFGGDFDVLDTSTRVRVEIRIVDTDGGDPIDWTANPEGRWGFVEVALPTAPHSWRQAGTVMPRADITFSLAVVGL